MDKAKEPKLTLEVTENGWTWTYAHPIEGIKTFSMVRSRHGAAGTEPGEPLDKFPEAIAEEIDSISPLAIMQELHDESDYLRERGALPPSTYTPKA
jgi:hypothetical protein